MFSDLRQFASRISWFAKIPIAFSYLIFVIFGCAPELPETAHYLKKILALLKALVAGVV
jgi:hypothetical protein